MRILILTLFAVAALAMTACSTSPQSRIDKNSRAFKSYSAIDQEKIRAGIVDIGFSPEMVFLALGEPERKMIRSTETGQDEVWVFRNRQPSLGFGVGVGAGGGRTGYGGGVSVSTSSYGDEEATRVVFRAGKVSSIETRVK